MFVVPLCCTYFSKANVQDFPAPKEEEEFKIASDCESVVRSIRGESRGPYVQIVKEIKDQVYRGQPQGSPKKRGYPIFREIIKT
jgi:hypothetical protein